MSEKHLVWIGTHRNELKLEQDIWWSMIDTELKKFTFDIE